MPTEKNVFELIENAQQFLNHCEKQIREFFHKGFQNEKLREKWQAIREEMRALQEQTLKNLDVKKVENFVEKLKKLAIEFNLAPLQEDKKASTKAYSEKIFEGFGKIISFMRDPKSRSSDSNVGGVPQLWIEGLMDIVQGLVGMIFGGSVAEKMGKIMKFGTPRASATGTPNFSTSDPDANESAEPSESVTGTPSFTPAFSSAALKRCKSLSDVRDVEPDVNPAKGIRASSTF